MYADIDASEHLMLDPDLRQEKFQTIRQKLVFLRAGSNSPQQGADLVAKGYQYSVFEKRRS